MSNALSHWAILAALDFWRDAKHYRECEVSANWQPIAQRRAVGAKVGIMGIGAIGGLTAQRFAALGFDVRGWARSLRQIDNVKVFAGDDGLAPFLDGLEILVSVLPLTPATKGIMNNDMFNRLAKGAFIINGGRGPQLVEDDLLDAIDRGQIAGAALDVFTTDHCPAVTHSGRTQLLLSASCCGANPQILLLSRLLRDNCNHDRRGTRQPR